MPSFNPTNDLTVVADGAAPIQLLRRGATPGTPGTTIAAALRRAMSVRAAATSGGRWTAADAVWHLPAEPLDAPPRLGDVLLDAAAERWTILEVRAATLGSRWRVVARRLAAHHALDDTITVLVTAYGKTASGTAQATWRVGQTGVRARIVPAETAIAAAEPAQQTVRRCRILVAEELELGRDHRLQAADGTHYRVVRVLPAANLGELTTIEAEALP